MLGSITLTASPPAHRHMIDRPAKPRWVLGKPSQTLAISDGETTTLLQVAEKRAARLDADSPETFDLIESRVTSGIHQPKDRRLKANVP
jgi:hypothetical protein